MTDYNYIDIAAIEEISSGNEDLTLDIINMFLQEAPRLLSEIREHLDKGELQEIAPIAHKLKPMYAYIGANSVQKKIAEIENQSNQGMSLEVLTEGITGIENKMAEIISEINIFKSNSAFD